MNNPRKYLKNKLIFTSYIIKTIDWITMLRQYSNFLILLIIGFIQLSAVYADEQPVARQYNFRSYTAFDGLPQAQVTSVQQDEKGYIWIGSYSGVTRFNGRDFVTYNEPLPNNFISSMVKDQHGRIILTSGNGFCYLESGSFDCSSSQSLPLSNLNAVHADKDNSLWFAAEGGLIHLSDSETKVFTVKEGIPSPTVRAVLKDRSGKVWVGTSNGLATLENGQFVSYKPEIFAKALVKTIFENDSGIWIGGNEGLYFVSNKDQSLRKIGENTFDGNIVFSLFEDSNNSLWIGTSAGLYRLVEGKIERLSPQKGLLSVAIHAINEDREGTLWFGSDAGLIKYVPGPFVSYTTEQGMSNDFVRTMSVDPDGKIWMGTRHGVSIFTPETESFETLTTELKTDRIRVYSILALENDSALIGTRAGLIYWKDGQAVKHYTHEDGLKSSYVGSLLLDSHNRVWAGTSRGLSQWKDGKILDVKSGDLPVAAIYTMKEDRLGRIWLGTGNHGLFIFEPENGQFSKVDHIEAANNVTFWSLDVDQLGNIWAGSNGNGLLKISEDLKLLEVLNSKNKLRNDFVWQVKVDSTNHVWAFTNSGLKRYDHKIVTHFDGSDGLPDMEGSATAVLENKNGELWFGTGFGVTRFVPSLENIDGQAPPILLEGVWQGDRQLSDQVSLPSDIGTLTFRFASLTYQNDRDIKFSFRLLGADSNWSAPQNIRTLQLTSLSAGKYELQLKAVKADRIYSDKAASFSFTIRPPFWQTWWFIGICTIALILMVTWLTRRRLKKLGIEKNQLENIVAERTAELSSINQELNRLVVTDDLTKLYNRRHLMDCLQRELSLLSRSSTASNLSFIILDVDHFKAINDTHGHRVGDEVLVKLANRINESCRKTDVAARYGGEEFAVILPYTDQAGALICAEKIRKDIGRRAFKVDSLNLKVTISLGLVTVDSNYLASDSSEFDKVIKKADAALYRSKEKGRNQTNYYQQDIDVIQ